MLASLPRDTYVPGPYMPPVSSSAYWRRDDGCVGADVAAGADPHLPDGSQLRIVDGAGHFLHLERPDEVNRLVLDWLSR